MSAVLALDTSGRSADVAVGRGGKLLARTAHDGTGAYAESLLPLVDRALATARLNVGELSAIAVVEGPGSFTGLRIGIMTAKTICYASGLPLQAATTLRLLAAAAARAEPGAAATRYLGLADAGRGHAFAELFLPSAAGELAAVGPVQRIALAQLAELLDEGAGRTAIAAVASESLAAARALAERCPALLAWELPSLAAELALAAGRSDAAVRRVDPATLVPMYLSPSQAERARGVDLRDEVHRRAATSPAAEPS